MEFFVIASSLAKIFMYVQLCDVLWLKSRFWGLFLEVVNFEK